MAGKGKGKGKGEKKRAPPVPGQCPELNGKGKPCGMAPLQDSPNGECYAHDPRRKAEREAARKKGGKNRRVPTGSGPLSPDDIPPLESVEEIRTFLREVLRRGLSTDIAAPKLRAIIAGVALAADLLKTGDLEGQVRELRALVEERLMGGST